MAQNETLKTYFGRRLSSRGKLRGRPDNGPGRYPDFLIIGAPRAGTTTLASELSRHPQVFLCDPKEPFFFSHDSVRARGDVWYKSLFARCRQDQICGEASTSYSCWPECGDVPGRVARAMPGVRLIYVMRHPVERVYSHYDYDRVRLGTRLGFEDTLKRDSRYVNISMYLQQIRQYLGYFDRTAFLFLLFDDLIANRESTLHQITAFLDLTPFQQSANDLHENSGDEYYVRVHTTQRLRLIPGISWLADRLPRSLRDRGFGLFRRSPAYRWFARQHKLPRMRHETRQYLLTLFDRPNRELADFLGRDLSAWST